MFIEEPVLGEHYEALKELRRAECHAHSPGPAAVFALGLRPVLLGATLTSSSPTLFTPVGIAQNPQDSRYGRGL